MLQGLLLNAVLAVAPAAPPPSGQTTFATDFLPAVVVPTQPPRPAYLPPALPPALEAALPRAALPLQEPPKEEPKMDEIPAEEPAAEREDKEAEPPPPEAPEDLWPLMENLQGTLPGTLLLDHGIRIYGWAAGSFTASTASSLNTPVVWNDKANEFLLQQFWTRFEKPVDTTSRTPTLGFRSDWLIGSDYRFTLPRGIFNNQLVENDGGPNNYGIDPIAFYGEAYFPGLFKGTGVKLGRWFTPFGVESLEAVSTPTISRSYAFNWAPPFTHTGAIATTKVTDTVTVAAGAVLGNDIFIDPADEGRFVGTVGWAAPDGRNSVTFGTSIGRGSFNEAEQFNNINVFDVVYTHKFNDRLSYTFETIYGYQNGVTLPDDGSVSTAHWGSVVNYLFFTLSPRLTAMTRLEFFDDFEGSRTGFEGLYTALTVGAAFRPTPDVILRAEARVDYNGETKPFEGEHSIGTAALEFILRF
jgi:hypothetical protein